MDWIAPLVSLSAMEIVLGIDNVVFIAILVGRLLGPFVLNLDRRHAGR